MEEILALSYTRALTKRFGKAPWKLHLSSIS